MTGPVRSTTGTAPRAASPRRAASPITCLIQCGALLAAVAAAALTHSVTLAQHEDSPPPLPDSASPLADPVIDTDAVFTARKATAWQDQDQDQAAGRVRYLLLEGDVRFEMGAYGFEAARAVARIVTEPRAGRPIQHLALYLDEARSLHDHGPVTAEGRRLLVTASTTGGVALETDLLERDQPTDHELVEEGIARMQRRDRRLSRAMLAPPDTPLYDEAVWARREALRRKVPPPAVTWQEAGRTIGDPEQAAMADEPLDEQDAATDEAVDAPPPERPRAEQRRPPVRRPGGGVLPTTGVLRFSADRVYSPGQGQNVVMLIGNVRLFYDDRVEDRQVTLQTERAVLFLRDRDEQDEQDEQPPTAGDEADIAGGLDAAAVSAIYLEDNAIITDGQFTVRAPRVFYDLQRNEAMLFEAVMYTYDLDRQVPLYARADMLRQVSRDRFEARGVRVTTSAFAEPHFAIGASRLTLEYREEEPEPQEGEESEENEEGDEAGETGERGTEQYFTATHSTIEVLGLPVFYWPYLAAETEDIPIRSVGASYSSDTGLDLTTRWDLFALLGYAAPDDVDAELAVDYRGEHGAATGLDVDYDPNGMTGELNSYLLPFDHGTDQTAGRQDIEHDGDTRGYLHWQHRQELAEDWQLLLEGSYVSDETFLEEFFRSDAAEARPYETSLYLTRRQNDELIDLLATANFNDFTPQLTQLQTPGYDVEKAPELGYYRIGTSLWENRLTWYSETRAGYMRADFGQDTPADRGFTQNQSLSTFGFGRNTTFEQNADAMNFPEDWRLRFDSRQEIAAPMEAGAFDITPYVAGRVTAYDEDFESYRGEEELYRLWGAVGTRFNTQFHRQYEAESRLLNLRGLRHIVEPGVDMFLMGSTVESEDLPVYDPQVEAIAEGAGVRLGLTNTLQTERGGPGQWRSVDWIELQTDLILRSDDAETDALLPRYYAYRPEYSTGGDHFYSRLLWMVSDTLGVTGDLTYDLESDNMDQWRLGLTLDHTPRLRSMLTYTEIDPLDSRLLTYGFDYQLTTKYRVGFQHRLDFGENESRTMRLTLDRRLPQWRVRLYAAVDEVDDEQSVGIVFIPEGFSGRSAGIGDNLFRP